MLRAGSFSEGLASVWINKHVGVIDATGAMVIPAEYDYISMFHEGLAHVKVDKKWGYIDRNGKMVIEPRFESATQGRWEDA
jgi:hypothetical protein